MSVEVRMVKDKADFRAFLEFPYQLYKDDPYYVPELPSLRRETFDRQKHPAWEYLTGELFAAYRGAECVGTISAHVNHRHNEFHGESMGFFGSFDCINDQSVANALFAAAEAYLRAQQVSAIQGPVTLTSNEMYGVLVDSFDQLPMVLMPYNYPYYRDLLENYGFRKVMRLDGWKMEMARARTVMYESDGITETKVLRVVRRNNERRNISTRSLDTRRKKAEFQTLKDIYNSAWEKNWGFVPLTERELDALEENLGLLLMPDYTFFASVKGQVAGFVLAIPNINEALHHVKPHPGLPEAWWLLKTLWHFKIRSKITSVRGILLGVKEEFRGIGVESALYLALAEALVKRQRYDWIEAGWVLETNLNSARILEHLEFENHRHHHIYQKDL